MANNTIYPFGPGGQTPVTIPIADDLVTDRADIALSAKQGKVLAEMIETTGLQCAEVNEDGIFFVDNGLNVGVRISGGGVDGINVLTMQDI